MFNQKILARAVLAALLPAAMTGCGSVATKVGGEDFNKASRVNEDLQVKKNNLVQPKGNFRIDGGVYVDSKPLTNTSNRDSEPLPPVFIREVGFDFRAPVSLRTLMDRLSDFSGALVTITPDVYSFKASGQETGNQAAMQSSANIVPPAAVPGAAAGASPSAAARPTGVNGPTANQLTKEEVLFPEFVFSGTIQEALDRISARTGLGWKWDGKQIVIYRYDTVVFKIKHMNGASDQTGKAATSSKSYKYEPYKDIDKIVKDMLSAEGKASVNESMSTITVTDTPLRLRMVENYIKKLNAEISQQVRLRIDVFSVSANDEDNYGLDFSALWTALSGKYSLGWVGSGGATSMTNKLTATLLTPVNAMNGTLQGASTGSPTSIIAGALSKMGKTSLVSSNTLTTTNGQPAPFDVTTSTVYLQSTQTTIQGTSGATTTTLQPGTIDTGFQMSVTPKVIESDKIALEYMLQVSDLLALNTFTTSGNSIQMPTTSKRNIYQHLNVKNGETIILTGLQQTNTNMKNQGPGNADYWALGGNKNNTSSKTSLVVVITPTILAD